MSEASEIAMQAVVAMCNELKGDMAQDFRQAALAVENADSAMSYEPEASRVEGCAMQLEKALKHCHRWLALNQALKLVDNSEFVDVIAALEEKL